MTLPGYLSLKLRCTEAEALGVLRARDVVCQLVPDPSFWLGAHALAVHNSRVLYSASLVAPKKGKRAEIAGQSKEAALLADALHRWIAQVDALEKEFTESQKPGGNKQQLEED